MSSEIEAYYIPKHLDDPDMVFIFTYNEFILLFIATLGFVAMKHLLIGIAIEIIAFKLCRKFKRVGHRSLLQELMYCYLPNWFSGFKHLPESHVELYIG
jgi:conjugal transfer pilus assembly protein TraL